MQIQNNNTTCVTCGKKVPILGGINKFRFIICQDKHINKIHKSCNMPLNCECGKEIIGCGKSKKEYVTDISDQELNKLERNYKSKITKKNNENYIKTGLKYIHNCVYEVMGGEYTVEEGGMRLWRCKTNYELHENCTDVAKRIYNVIKKDNDRFENEDELYRFIKDHKFIKEHINSIKKLNL